MGYIGQYFAASYFFYYLLKTINAEYDLSSKLKKKVFFKFKLMLFTLTRQTHN